MIMHASARQAAARRWRRGDVASHAMSSPGGYPFKHRTRSGYQHTEATSTCKNDNDAEHGSPARCCWHQDDARTSTPALAGHDVSCLEHCGTRSVATEPPDSPWPGVAALCAPAAPIQPPRPASRGSRHARHAPKDAGSAPQAPRPWAAGHPGASTRRGRSAGRTARSSQRIVRCAARGWST